MPGLQKKHVVSTITVPMPHPDQSRRPTPVDAACVADATAAHADGSSISRVGSQPADEQSALILPNGNFVTTLTLNSRTCRWPVGDPTKLGFHYCGQPPKSPRPYCDAHERKSCQPLRSRPIHRPRLP